MLHLAWGFEQTLRVANWQQTIPTSLPAIAEDQRQVLNEAADNLDVARPAHLSDPPDLRDPQAAVDWLAKQIDQADDDLTRAFRDIDPETQEDLSVATI